MLLGDSYHERRGAGIGRGLRWGDLAGHPSPRLPRVRPVTAAVLIAALAGVAGRRGPAGAASLEYRVKAAFLLNFAKFIEWPPQAFARPDAPYVICVLGQDPFGSDLDATVAEAVVEGRRMLVRRPRDARGIPGCHILFVAPSERAHLPDILATVDSAPILTVGDDEDFTRQGGELRFYVTENRVRFEINLPAAERAHLKLSAKLLSLARVVGKPGKN